MKVKTDRNYDNRVLNEDETLVPYFINEADLDSYVNPDSIIRFFIGSVSVKCALTAFKKGDAANWAKAQFYSYIRDLNGQFHCKDSFSYNDFEEIDEIIFKDKDKKKSKSGEKINRVIARSKETNPAEIYVREDNVKRMVLRLMKEAPQLLAAAIFHRDGLSGSEFQKAMRLGHSRSAELQEELSDILHDMIYLGYDYVELPKRKSKYDDYYRKVALQRINEVLDDIRIHFSDI